jgi:Dyp-type peroxidase family
LAAPVTVAPDQVQDIIVPLDQVQGIILRGYEPLEASRFLLLAFDGNRPGPAKDWLKGLIPSVTAAATRPEVEAVNLAFTCEGFRALGLAEGAFEGFSPEFREGMDTDHRNRVLGDTSPERLPGQWVWGNRDDKGLHALLLLYAKDATQLEDLSQRHSARLGPAGITVRHSFDSIRLAGRKEHFGFRDGISQPSVEGVYKSSPPQAGEAPVPENIIKAGEVLLGYRNGYDKYPLSPGVPGQAGEPLRDFGRDGSYLVFRQLSQKVRKFWRYVDAATARPGQTEEEHHAARLMLASKMVGRWPSGAPLSLSPGTDRPELMDENDFTYAGAGDPDGLSSPIGSHTRRSNPRDALEPGPGAKGRLSPEESLRVTKLHRIIRRGRQYGPPVAESMGSCDILNAKEPAGPEPDRGLLFLCFNANIARQFEFIQQTWVNNPKFGGLYRDSDPLMGQRHPVALEHLADAFTVQGAPVRRRHQGLPELIRVRGGGYFFMPGIEALKHLAGLPASLRPLES